MLGNVELPELSFFGVWVSFGKSGVAQTYYFVLWAVWEHVGLQKLLNLDFLAMLDKSGVAQTTYFGVWAIWRKSVVAQTSYV